MIAIVVLALAESLLVSALAGYYISAEKGRGGLEGLLFGFLFGPFGLMLTVLMPEPPERLPAVVPFKTIMTAIGLTMCCVFLSGLMMLGVTSAARQVTQEPGQIMRARPTSGPEPISIERKNDPALFWVLGLLGLGAAVLIAVNVRRNDPTDRGTS